MEIKYEENLEVCDKCRYICRTMTEKKKNPTGLRMNEEKLKFVMEKEGLSSRQKVVNFLLDKYWWEQKIGIVPTLELQKPQKEPKIEVAQELPKEEPQTKGTKQTYATLLNQARLGIMKESDMYVSDISPNQRELLIRKNNENKEQQ